MLAKLLEDSDRHDLMAEWQNVTSAMEGLTDLGQTKKSAASGSACQPSACSAGSAFGAAASVASMRALLNRSRRYLSSAGLTACENVWLLRSDALCGPTLRERPADSIRSHRTALQSSRHAGCGVTQFVLITTAAQFAVWLSTAHNGDSIR